MNRLNIAQWSVRKQVFLGPLLLFGILLMVLGGAVYSTRQIQLSDAQMDETLSILREANVVGRLVIDMETSVRGYVLTGDERFLHPYISAENRLPIALARLEQLLAERPVQRARFELLSNQIEGWRTMVGDVEIQLVRQGEDPIAMVRSGVGRMRMDEIRTSLDEFEAAERDRLNELTGQHQQANRILMNLYGAALIIGLAGLALAVWIGNQIADPIEELEQDSVRMAAGDYQSVLRTNGATKNTPENANTEDRDTNVYIKKTGDIEPGNIESGDGEPTHGEGLNELGRTRSAFTAMVQAVVAAQAALAEQARQAEQARTEMTAILDAVSEAILLMSPQQQIVVANRRVLDLFDIAPTDLVEQSPQALQRTRSLLFEDVESVEEYIAEAMNERGQKSAIIVRQKWPETRELELFTAPVMDDSDSYHGHVFAFRDITKEREADRLKNEFVSMVSHELRTPLTSIKGFVDLMASGDAGPLTEEQSEFLEVVKNNADRLVTLVNDLLDISRLEAGRVELNKSNLAIDALLRSLLVTLRPQIEARRHQVVQRMDADLPPVFGDGDRLNQIFINIISNAIKYTPTGGTITIGATQVGEFIQIDVTDTGVGLNEAELARLFTRFFRAKNRATQDAGGTGLGLSITKSLVEMHNGTIDVTSAPGMGTTFRIRLPVASEGLIVRPRTENRGGTILVVEDERDIAELVRVYLSQAGYEVQIAGDAPTALEVAKTARPDLILLDIVLPGVDGMTLLSWLKSDDELANVPVVLLSILPNEGQGRILGAVDYLLKPIDKNVLLGRIGAILSTQQAPQVLVIHDDISEREYIRAMLHRSGYQTEVAETEEDVLLRIANNAPDLLLMDAQSTMATEGDVLELLGYSESTARLPIVLITGKGNVELFQASPQLKTMKNLIVLTRPFAADELTHAVEDWRRTQQRVETIG